MGKPWAWAIARKKIMHNVKGRRQCPMSKEETLCLVKGEDCAPCQGRKLCAMSRKKTDGTGFRHNKKLQADVINGVNIAIIGNLKRLLSQENEGEDCYNPFCRLEPEDCGH